MNAGVSHPWPDQRHPVRVLTLWQPWATAMARGVKRVETRSWPLPQHFERPVWCAIHAGAHRMRRPELEIGARLGLLRPEDPTEDPRYHQRGLPLRSIVAIVRFVRSVPTDDLTWANAGSMIETPEHIHGWVDYGDQVCVSDNQRPSGDYSPGRYAWLADNIIPFTDPLEGIAGQQGLWTPDDDVQHTLATITHHHLSVYGSPDAADGQLSRVAGR